MKHILFTVLTFISFNILAQVPQGVGYQGVATDSEGIELVNQSISIRASVLSGSANGTIEWEETHSTSTDTFGLFNLTIGQGNNTGNGLQANFADISWGTNTHFLKIEMDATGGNDFTFMGTNQMMSVPYALFAENTTLDTVSIQDIVQGTSLWVEHPTQNKITSPGKSVGVRGYPGELDSTIDLTIYSSGEEYTPSKIRLKGTNENSSYSSWSDLSSSYDNHITSSKFSISTRNMGVMNENFVINSLGHTGIGTTDPIATLHIEPEFPAKGLLVNTEYANGGIYIQNNANTSAKLVLNQVGSVNGQAYYLVSRNDGQFVIGNANDGIVDMLTIDSLGNIGITEEAPKADLHITDENDFTDVLIESGGDFEDASLWLKNPSKTWRIHGDQNDSDKFKIGLWTDYSEIGGSLLMEYPFVIDTIGRVGVGAPSPNANLHIYNQDSVVLKVQTNSNGQSGAYLRLNEDNTTGGYVHYKSSGDNSNALRLGTATIANGDLNMLTLRAGNVGVNTDNPQQILHINDVMRLEPRETAPENPSKGDIYMDDVDNKLKYFDGNEWQSFSGDSYNNNLTSNTKNLKFPEGATNETIHKRFYDEDSLIVPGGKNLYITSIFHQYGNGGIFVNDIVINDSPLNSSYTQNSTRSQGGPWYFKEGDIIKAGNGTHMSGFFTDTFVQPITLNNLETSNYAIPNGKIFVALNIYNSNSNLSVNNQYFFGGNSNSSYNNPQVNETVPISIQPIIFAFGDTISSNSNISSINGYLADEDYFDNNVSQNNTNSNNSSGNMIVSTFGDTLTMNGQSIIIPDISYSNYTPTYGSVDDIDGNTYQTVLIYGKEWMAEDLIVSKFSNGDDINQVTGSNGWSDPNCSTPSFAFEPSGWLGPKAWYNAYVVQDSRNVCPTGWHVATETEYADLFDLLSYRDTVPSNLQGNGYIYYWDQAGPKLKKPNSGWNTVSNYPIGQARNDSYLGFECYSQPSCTNFESFSFTTGVDRKVYTGTQAPVNGGNYCININHDTDRVEIQDNNPIYLYSVRCVKD